MIIKQLTKHSGFRSNRRPCATCYTCYKSDCMFCKETWIVEGVEGRFYSFEKAKEIEEEYNKNK